MIYCVEDDSSIRELETYTLNSMQLNAQGFGDAASFFDALQDNKPNLIILDVMLPDMEGTEILRKLRQSQKTKSIPIIMATAKASEVEKIKALDAGADDYLTKPFSMMEMVARVKAVLRRCSNENSQNEITVGAITINQEKHCVYVEGQEVALTNKEYELLLLLCKHVGRVYQRDTLLDLIWGENLDVFSRTLDVHIRTLRSKLKSQEHLIKTVRGVGYKVDL